MGLAKARVERKDKPSEAVTFQFNPTTLSFTKAAKLSQETSPGAQSAPAVNFGGTEPLSLDLTMLLDDVEDGGTKVVQSVDQLVKWTTPTRQSKGRSTPALVFSWGGLTLNESPTFLCVLEKVSVTYQMFDQTGRPIRAECRLTLKEAPDEPEGTNPTSGARRPFESYRVRRGDTLTSIAYRAYGDAARWRQIAEHNGVVDPLRLAPDTMLVVPDADLDVLEELMADSFNIFPTVKVDGGPLPPAVERVLTEVTVDSGTECADACVLRFVDPGRDLLDTLAVDFYQELVLEAPRAGTTETDELFRGLVAAIEFELDEAGSHVRVEAFDHSFLFRQGRHTRTFNDVTDSDLVVAIAGELGVPTGEIASTSLVHEHVAQVNETDWDFLRRRARALDHEIALIDGKVTFRPSAPSSAAPEPGDFDSVDRYQLVPGSNLLTLRSRLTAAQQVVDVEVRGWDPRQKVAVVATADASTRGAAMGEDPSGVAGKRGAPRQLQCRPGLQTQAECDAAAAALAERMGSTFVVIEGTADGDPRLRAGVAVSIGRAGRFDGQYTISSARHRFGPGGYRTEFAISGEHDRSFYGLTGRPRDVGGWVGVYPAIVTNAKDPEELGRVKLSYPWLSDDFESDWSRLVQLGAGAERGRSWVPEVGDEVVVAFVEGDPGRAVVVGGLHNGADAVAVADAVRSDDGAVVRRGLVTRRGHRLVFDEDDGKERIELATGDGKVVVLLDQAKGSLSITTDKDVSVSAGGNATVTAERDLKVEAGGSATISARSGLEITSRGEVTISGSMIKLN